MRVAALGPGHRNSADIPRVTAFATDSILPPDPLTNHEGGDGDGLPLLHDREYCVRAYRLAPDRIRLVAGVREQKPPGLYIADDPDPLTVHHMQLALDVSFPELAIVGVTTRFESFPRDECPTIVPRYDELIGISIARGFTHRVRELFGGPRGCTHTTALLQAMAPVAVQCFWSMASIDARHSDAPGPFDPERASEQAMGMLVNTCHAWAEDGPAIAARRAGMPEPIPVFMRERLRARGG
jgi:hypothetical protein